MSGGDLKVVPLRTTPTVADIPGQLRLLADEIESGEVSADACLCVLPQGDEWPLLFGWGDHLGTHGNIAVLEMAKTWFINNLTAR